MIQVDRRRPAELSPEQRRDWLEIMRSDARLAHAFLSPGFADAVDRVCGDVQVLVIENSGRSGFLPVHTGRRGRLRACGFPLSDMQAVVAPQSWSLDPRDIMSATQSSTFQFDHWIAHSSSWRTRQPDQSFLIDLGDGLDNYTRSQLAGSRFLEQMRRQERRAERRYGPLRFEWRVDDAPMLSRLAVGWKRNYARRLGARDYFAEPWQRELVEQCVISTEPDMAAVVSALFAGDQPIAILISLRFAETLSAWIPAYDHRFGDCSPGAILHWRLVQEALNRNVNRIDLGRGENQLKKRLANDRQEVFVGTLRQPTMANWFGRLWERQRETLTSYGWARAAARWTRQIPHRLITPLEESDS